jgi:hypothetical protein
MVERQVLLLVIGARLIEDLRRLHYCGSGGAVGCCCRYCRCGWKMSGGGRMRIRKEQSKRVELLWWWQRLRIWLLGHLLLQRQHLLFGGTCRKVGSLRALAIAVYTARQAHPEVATSVVFSPTALLAHDGLVLAGCSHRFRAFGSNLFFIIIIVVVLLVFILRLAFSLGLL